MEWNYISKKPKSNGYEDVQSILQKYTVKYVNACSDKKKNKIYKKIFKIYRNKNIFPITYYNEQGIFNAIERCVKQQSILKNNILMRSNCGNSLCTFLFPNLTQVQPKNSKGFSLLYRYLNDKILMSSIKLAYKIYSDDNYAKPSVIKKSLELHYSGIATNFPPIKAKSIYEKYCKYGDTIYDFSCGFGGRMLGALSSKNDYKYIGCEPCSESYKNLLKLGDYITRYKNKNSTFTQYSNIYDIHKIGSEDFKYKKDSVDFAFSSPPYFSLEKYCDEETQCYIKFPTLKKWFRGYVRPTIKNIYYMLKPNKFYAVNIADFKIGSKKVRYVKKWIKISKKVGFKLVDKIKMPLTTRIGSGSAPRFEYIYVFKKE